MYEINEEKAISMLELAIESKPEKGAFVYKRMGSSCTYVNNLGTPKQRPGCMVGTAFILAGLVDMDFFAETREREVHLNGDDVLALANVLSDEKDIHMTREALQLFSRAQDYQDAGNTWGESLHIAVTE